MPSIRKFTTESCRSSTCKLLISACALVAALVLTGCQENRAEDSEAAPEGSKSASTSPSKSASSAGPAANIPVPAKPALADKNTKAGLEAFTKWWFELFSYAYVTNDWKKFDAVTSAGCGTCGKVKALIEEIYENGRWLKGGELEVTDFGSKFELNTAGSIVSFVRIGQGPITFFESDGTKLRTDPARKPTVDAVIAVYDNGRWIMLDFGIPPDT